MTKNYFTTSPTTSIPVMTAYGEVRLAVPPIHPETPRKDRVRIYEYVMRRQYGLALELAKIAYDIIEDPYLSAGRNFNVDDTLRRLMQSHIHTTDEGISVGVDRTSIDNGTLRRASTSWKPERVAQRTAEESFLKADAA